MAIVSDSFLVVSKARQSKAEQKMRTRNFRRHVGNVPKEISVMMNLLKEICAVVRDRRSSSPAPNSKAKTDGGGQAKMKALQTQGAQFRADTEIVFIRHVVS